MRQILLLSSIGILCVILFCGISKLFQNETIYHNTIGVVSQNYERTGGWNDYNIAKVSKPYLEFENDNYLRWDAAIYMCISKRMYTSEDSCYNQVRAAFFPLFPLLWKITQLSPQSISLLNYLIFVLSISLLVIHLLPGNNRLIITSFIVLITLPTTVIYMVPYSESLFLLCMTIASLGILKEKYHLYFIGILLMSMVRPATVFVLFAIISTEMFNYIKYKRTYPVISHVFSRSLPFLIGYMFVLAIQYWSSGSLTVFFDAHKHWSGGFQSIKGVTDWSVEGFGLNTFSIFFVAIPTLAYLFYLIVNINSKKQSFFKIDGQSKRNYLLLISSFYLSGIFVFILITSGGNFHSFFRFTMCSPFFYILALILMSNLLDLNQRLGIITFCVALLLLCLYLSIVEYGGDRLQFSFFGLFMLSITFFYLLNRRFLSFRADSIILFLIVILNTVWNTYMLNVFFSNGWIFT